MTHNLHATRVLLICGRKQNPFFNQFFRELWLFLSRASLLNYLYLPNFLTRLFLPLTLPYSGIYPSHTSLLGHFFPSHFLTRLLFLPHFLTRLFLLTHPYSGISSLHTSLFGHFFLSHSSTRLFLPLTLPYSGIYPSSFIGHFFHSHILTCLFVPSTLIYSVISPFLTCLRAYFFLIVCNQKKILNWIKNGHQHHCFIFFSNFVWFYSEV